MSCNHLCYRGYTLFQPKQVSCVCFTSLICSERCGYFHILLMIIDSSSLEMSPMGIVTILTTDGCQLLIVPLPQVSAVPPWAFSQAHLPSHLSNGLLGGSQSKWSMCDKTHTQLNCQHTVDFSGFEGLLQEWDQLHLIIL